MEASAQQLRATRELRGVYAPGGLHWVGDGFRVRTVFDPQLDADTISPFVLLDHAARWRFEPARFRRGVGEHPHRGFETVTFAYEGEIEHRDSSGGGGRIGPGDVQWMTAASGVVHEEMHSQAFSETGGDFEMVQLWVNLPAADKMSEPGYQSLRDGDFPRVRLGAAEARLVAGALGDARGPARTHTPMTVFDLRYELDGVAELDLPPGWNVLAVNLEGRVSAGRKIPVGHLGVFDRDSGAPVQMHGETGSRVLMLSGEPLGEPVVAYGPFVMNTREEIATAVRDFHEGKMGRLL